MLRHSVHVVDVPAFLYSYHYCFQITLKKTNCAALALFHGLKKNVHRFTMRALTSRDHAVCTGVFFNGITKTI